MSPEYIASTFDMLNKAMGLPPLRKPDLSRAKDGDRPGWSSEKDRQVAHAVNDTLKPGALGEAVFIGNELHNRPATPLEAVLLQIRSLSDDDRLDVLNEVLFNGDGKVRGGTIEYENSMYDLIVVDPDKGVKFWETGDYLNGESHRDAWPEDPDREIDWT